LALHAYTAPETATVARTALADHLRAVFPGPCRQY
jgi:hypothetical protein